MSDLHSILSVEHVSKTYESGPEQLRILEDVSFELSAGDILVITGESGSGKSTLLNIIGGLDRPDSGTISLRGTDIAGLDEAALSKYRSREIGFVFQLHYLLRDFTALENVYLPGYMAGMKKSSAMARAAELLDRVSLSGRRDHFPHQLSGGERQRVALARALVNDPAVILADEPTGNLDEKNSRNVENILFDLCRATGKSLILVTHDSGLAERASRHLALEYGVLEG